MTSCLNHIYVGRAVHLSLFSMTTRVHNDLGNFNVRRTHRGDPTVDFTVLYPSKEPTKEQKAVLDESAKKKDRIEKETEAKIKRLRKSKTFTLPEIFPSNKKPIGLVIPGFDEKNFPSLKGSNGVIQERYFADDSFTGCVARSGPPKVENFPSLRHEVNSRLSDLEWAMQGIWF